MSTLERVGAKQTDSIREAAEADMKILSDQAAFVIAVEQTRKYSKDSLELAQRSLDLATTSQKELTEAAKASTEGARAAMEAAAAARLAADVAGRALGVIVQVRTETRGQTTTLARIDENKDNGKPKIPLTLATILNLLLGLVYVILEIMKHQPPH